MYDRIKNQNERVLIFDKELNRFRQTHFDAYMRYKHTIKPIEDFIKYCDE